MAKEIEIKVPDIGGAGNVDVIEILVKVGDVIAKESPLITLESDKASMEIPSPIEGKVIKINTKLGDKVSEGDLILVVTSETVENDVAEKPQEPALEKTPAKKKDSAPQKKGSAKPLTKEVLIPDIGGATDVDVIDIMVKVGETVEKDQSLITLEGDKATMDIPSPSSGTVKELKIKLGDKVAQGTLILMLESQTDEADVPEEATDHAQVQDEKLKTTEPKKSPEPKVANHQSSLPAADTSLLFAGPAVRRMARELGVDLSQVKGSGRKTRITKEDIQSYVKSRLSEKSGSGQFNVPQAPVIDFSKFGEIETQALNKIKKITGINVHRSWITIPHVTQFDEADITELEAFRKSEADKVHDKGYKLTLLAFVCRVVSQALQVFPQFNASLDASGEQLILKKYFNIGIAVETPNGLVVPVIKNVDQLGVGEIAAEMARLSTKARDKGLMPTDMNGGCFTISSLGGIGGTGFTPIVNSPEVAILGLSRSTMKPVYDNGEFIPKLMLPLSLSYDHRVIDGAEAARFTRYISEALSDLRRVLL